MVTISSSPNTGNTTNAGAISGNAIGSTIGTIPAGVSGPGYSFLNGQGASSRNNLQALGATNIENQLKRASAQNEAYLNEAKDLYEPYRQAGVNSLDEYMKLLLGGVDGLKDDQNFQDMRDLTERQVMANRAVGGLLRSGGTASALNDSLLKFANTYYGNRLNQLKEGNGLGQYGTTGSSNLLEKLGGNATDLASALANIQMQRESNDAMIKAAREQAAAQAAAAKSASKSNLFSSLIGAAGTIVGSIYGGPAGGAAGGAVGSQVGSWIDG